MVNEHMQELLDQKIAGEEQPARELTVDEALQIAIHLHQHDLLVEADAVYTQILAADPGNARAMHFAGVLAHQAGRSGDGIALIQRSLELVPDAADWYNNLGIVLQESSRFNDAIEAYYRAIALDPRHATAYSNVGVLLRATGKPVEAEEAYRRAIELNPSHADAYTNLGVLLNSLKRTEEAVACFCRAITLRPKHPEARRLLALAHCALGETDQAIRIFEEWLAEEPDHPIARHMLSAVTGRDVPSRASDKFVEDTFDSFAASFESKLAKLSYRAPTLVSAMLDDAGLEAARQCDVLDAGCGTGLCGPLIARYARRLTGVDLSAGMLTHAKEKQVYDELQQGELTEYLRAHPRAFDIIVSADTLVYFGALDDVIPAAAGALRPGGVLVFTVEHGKGDDAPDYRLETHGRYTHARAYVTRLLANSGFTPEIGEAELRMESGVPVAGLVVRAVLSEPRLG